MSSKLTVSVAMIVKNEGELLGAALASVQGWADEIVVVDTGSTDNTVEVARAAGARIGHFDWCDDFAAARNASLDMVTGDWVLQLDADERLVGIDPNALKRALAALDGPTLVSLTLTNITQDGHVQNTNRVKRIFPNDDQIRYVGKIHERVVHASGTPLAEHTLATPTLEHLGYDPEIYEARSKGGRISILERLVAEYPNDLTHRFYLGRDLLWVQRFEEAACHLRVVVDNLLQQMTLNRPARNLLKLAAYHLAEGCQRIPHHQNDYLQRVEGALLRLGPDVDLLYCLGAGRLAAGNLRGGTIALGDAGRFMETSEGTSVSENLRQRPWKVWELLGNGFSDNGQYEKARESYEKALATMPEQDAAWPRVLNTMVGIALDTGSDAAPYVEGLLSRDDTPLGMVLFAIQARAEADGPMAGAAMLADALSLCPRIQHAEEFPAMATTLGIQHWWTSPGGLFAHGKNSDVDPTGNDAN